ncbi:MAG: FkbM family methyltransferase [Terriglobales bacterium]
MNRHLKEAVRQLLPRTLKRHRILGGALRGSLIITSWHDYPGAILGRTERPLLEYFAKNAGTGETWLDIGAHYGYISIGLCKVVGSSGRVFAFEPMINTAGCITRTRSINQLSQLTVIPIGLADRDDLSVESLNSTRGMIDSTLQGAAGCKETFLASRLDWLWPRISGPDPHIDGVKIDVQGMEIQVIEGMAGLMKRYRPKLLVEIHKGVSRPKLLDVIASLGYSPRGFAVEPLPGESNPDYADDRTYLFTLAVADPVPR